MSERNTYSEPTLTATLSSIAEHLKEETNIYLIGGGAMMFYGLKPSTKDIDLVFLDPKALSQFIDAAKKAGIKLTEDLGGKYRNIGASVIMVADSGIQLDLFNQTVCNALTVKDTVVARANHYRNMGKLSIHLMSPEDIVLFKGITEREADLEDIRTLIETGINWETVEEECLSQEDSGRWANLLLDKLSDLYVRYGINLRLRKIKEHADNHVLRKSFEIFMKEEEMSFTELHKIVKERTGYSESWTRAKLQELEKEDFIESRKRGRRRVYSLTKNQTQTSTK